MPLTAYRTLLGVAALAVATGCYHAPKTGVETRRRAAAEEYARRAVAAEQSLTTDSLVARTVGVTPLRVESSDTTLAPLGYGLADLLLTDLSRSRQLRVVDRVRLDALLRELQLSSKAIDPETAPRVGRLLRAERLVVGSLTSEPGGKVVVDARVADVGTQQVQGGLTASATLEAILDAEKQLALKLFEQLGVNLTPAERRLVEERATQNLAALLAYSRGVRFEVDGAYDQAAQQYESAMRLDPSFAIAGARLQSVRGGDGAASGSLQRAASMATNQVNAGFASPIGGVTDPAFRAPTVTIFIHVTTPP